MAERKGKRPDKKKQDNIINWEASKDIKSNDTTLPPSYTECRSLDDKLLNYKIKIDEFAMRGLNKYRNILTAPDCDCGCGGKGNLFFESRDELIGFCGSLLMDIDCDNCAIFLVHNDGLQEMILKSLEWDEEDKDVYPQISSLTSKLNQADLFAEMDAEFGLHCYGMMIEQDDNVWAICE